MSNEQLHNQINNAIGAHGSWKIKLRIAINKGKSDHSIEHVRCDDTCTFGKWIYSAEIGEPTRQSTPYNVIKRLHAEFHVCAAEVLKMATSGNTAGAANLLEGDFTARSEKLVRGLRKWRGEASIE
jgi:hypothetical protein